MLFFIVVIVFYNTAYATNIRSAGTTIFYDLKDLPCWNQDNIAILQARKKFEELAPPIQNPEGINKQYIRNTLRYCRQALATVQRNADQHTSHILKTALLDTFGAHLRSEILPPVRFAYYAGYISYRTARDIHNFYDKIKADLNTQGIGWKQPDKTHQWSNLSVAKILIGAPKLQDPCAPLITKRDAFNCTHLPPPKVDNKIEPSSVLLPLKTGGLVSLTSPSSENTFIKYYVTASRCILDSSPMKCRHSDFVNFNSEMWHWMKRDVAPHLMDEKLYAAYRGILRIAAAVQTYGTGLSRRNIFDIIGKTSDVNDEYIQKWEPWKKIKTPYIVINKEWTPTFYISVVLLIASVICLLQVCYCYAFRDKVSCKCSRPSRRRSCPQTAVSYAVVQSASKSSALPQQSAVLYTEKTGVKQLSTSRSKSSSLASVQTQKVYDLNENKEKLMSIIVSDNELSDGTTSIEKDSDEELEIESIQLEKETEDVRARSKSPPQLETPVFHLKLEKAPTHVHSAEPMYSTTTRTESTFQPDQEISESDWSATSSVMTGKTGTSTSTRSETSRNSRNLAWARRVVSRHTRRTLIRSSDTEQTVSFTTPPQSRQR